MRSAEADESGTTDRRRTASRDGAQTVRRALDILDCFAAAASPALAAGQISTRLGLSTPTVYRLLRALQAKDMVTWDTASRRYSLGPGIVRLAGALTQRPDVQPIALPHLARLREAIGETVGLHWLVGHRRVCVVELVSPHPIHMASGVGRTYPLHAGAAGKALLAWLSEEELAQYLRRTPLRRLNRATPVSVGALRAELARIRKQGFATSFSETVPGASALATAILDGSGRPVAAINVTGPESRWTRARMNDAVGRLLEETTSVMRQLGHQRLPTERNGDRNTGRPPARAGRGAKRDARA